MTVKGRILVQVKVGNHNGAKVVIIIKDTMGVVESIMIKEEGNMMVEKVNMVTEVGSMVMVVEKVMGRCCGSSSNKCGS